MFAASSVGMTSRFASPFSRESGKTLHADLLGERGVAVHLALDLEVRRAAGDELERLRASCRGRRVARAEVRMRQQRHLGVMPKRRISSAASSVISAICSAVGSKFT